MRVNLDTGAITVLDENRGIGVYAHELEQRLKQLVALVPTPEQADIIHNLVFKLFSSHKIICRQSIPTIVTVHDLIPLKFPDHYPLGFRGKLEWWQQKKQLQKIAGIITDSQASKRDIVKFIGFNPEKIFVVYLAANEIFRPNTDKIALQLIKVKYSLPEKFVLYVGDLNWNKNVVSLAEICLKLGYVLVVVGRQAVETNYNHNHPETRELIKFQSLVENYSTKIICLGTVPLKDLVGIYNLACVYIQPSRDEGFGLPVLEAMACGCPVLTSRAGSLPEICKGADLEFSPENLKRCWQSSTLRLKLSKLGLIQAAKFSWAKTVQETIKVYESI